MKLTACAIVRTSAGLIYAVTRKEDPKKLCLPGGHVEPKDFVFKQGTWDKNLLVTLSETARREFIEEVGASFTNPHIRKLVFAGVDDHGNYTAVFNYSWSRVEGLVKPETSVEIVTVEDLITRSFMPMFYHELFAAGVFNAS